MIANHDIILSIDIILPIQMINIIFAPLQFEIKTKWIGIQS